MNESFIVKPPGRPYFLIQATKIVFKATSVEIAGKDIKAFFEHFDKIVIEDEKGEKVVFKKVEGRIK